ncbi:FAD-dependent oxidoreductase [Bdellovibrio sp. HCB2-146]|uniref:FAD-dependent oxidoreductase n=1 Tax=Bdellovibrio sp. HCB2-146 TaxID=3394362 RepID=UPI0039BC4689
MATSAQIRGPDLTAGIHEDLLREGEVLLGHVGEENVMLTRQGQEIYAIGAVCSHYGGPLQEGTIEGTDVHCPWHHSVFSLRTGEALKPPALNPVSCFRTEVRENMIYVTEKIAFVPPRRKGTETQQFLIIGSGAAGVSAAVTLRRQGFLGSVTIVSEDKFLPYDRPNLSKDYLAGNAPEEWIPLWSKEFYEQNHIRFELSTRAEKIDATKKQVHLSNGKTLHYDKCLLATGGKPIKPPIPGIEKDHVYMLRSLQDCRRIIARTSWASRVLIIGAGFIGLEAAASLRARNMDVLVVAPEEMPLMKVLGVHVGSFLKKIHEEHGVEFHLGHTVKEIRDRSVVLDSKVALDCDFVIVGTGIKPDTDLAEQAGCEIDNGVLVNEYLETTVPDIFAAGDIARWPDPHAKRRIRVEHWEVAERHGQVAALNMLGDHVHFQDVPFFWTQHYDVSLGYIGFSDSFDRMDVMGSIEKRDFAVAFYEDTEVAALLTVGRDRESLLVEEALAHFDQKRVHQILSDYESRI